MMAPINITTVKTASKELGNKVVTKIRDLVSNIPAPSLKFRTGATTRFILIDPEDTEYAFTKAKGSVSPKKLKFLDLEKGEFILLCRQSPKGNFDVYHASSETKMHKVCLICTGATADFPELIAACLTPEALQAFASHGFTKLLFQVGGSMDVLLAAKPPKAQCFGMEIEAFSFNPAGLKKEMQACHAEVGKSLEGMVITHGGSGTLLEAFRRGLPIIVVPNEKLLDNHQDDLAKEMQRQGYLVSSSPENLARAIGTASEQDKLPRTALDDMPRGLPGGIASIADAVAGYDFDPDDFDDDEEGGVRLYTDEDIARDLGQEAQVKSMLD